MRLRHPARPALVALLGVLAACSSTTEDATRTACPPVAILGDANKLVQFRPGAGHDATDVELEAEISGFRGECTYGKTSVDMLMRITLDARLGPADTDGVAELTYFVAVPAYYPSPAAKATFPVRLEFPKGTTRVRYIDEQVSVQLPLAAGAGTAEVMLGFQLTPDQLDFNRQRR